jgi:hypothetical protein
LETKQKEKQGAIDGFNEANRKDMELFEEKKKEKEVANETKISGNNP